MALVSIIVPVYNVEKYLSRCVESILKQTMSDFELILIDDGSPDKCGLICENYAALDKRIIVIHQENRGLSGARNSGLVWALNNSNSKWITFIDSDDWVKSFYLESMVKLANNKNLDLVIGGFEISQGLDPDLRGKINAKKYDTEYFYVHKNLNATVAWGKLFKKTLFSSLRFPEGRIHEDEYIIYKILFKYDSLWYIDQPLYSYFYNPMGIMNREWNLKRMDSLLAIENQILFFVDNKHYRAAESRFICLMQQLLFDQYCISNLAYLSKKQKKELKQELERKVCFWLKKYGKYKWITIRNGDLFFQAYGHIYIPFKYVHLIWVNFGKRLINKLRKMR